MKRPEFSTATQRLALIRQKLCCASCGSLITRLGEAGRSEHPFGEIAHARRHRLARQLRYYL